MGNLDYSKCSNLYRRLPGAEIEAKLVSDKLNTTPLLGKAATKEEVLKRMKSSEFIYLATHGHADVDSPLTKSHLVFAGDEKSCGFWKKPTKFSLTRAFLQCSGYFKCL
ncbi:MAG: CHAT domain-containing protein [Chitinophagales bacterium]